MTNYTSDYYSGYADALRDVGKMLQKKKDKSLVAAGDKFVESADKIDKANDRFKEASTIVLNNYISAMSFPGSNREPVMNTNDVKLLAELMRKGIVKWDV